MATIVDSYSESNRNGSNGTDATRPALGQSFTGDGGVLHSAVANLTKSNSPTGSAYAKIYAHSGTFGTDGIPTGAALATSGGVDVSTFPTGGSFSNFTFTFTGADKITLTNGTKYFLVIEYSAGDSTNFISWGEDNSSPTHAGNRAFYTSGTWAGASTADFCFYVYKDDTSSASASASASRSLSPSSSASASASQSVSSSLSPSPAIPLATGIMRIAKDGINVLTNSDPEKFIYSSQYGTLKYYQKTAITAELVATGVGGVMATRTTVDHNLGYYPFVEAYVSVYITTPNNEYHYVPFVGAGATVLYSANMRITTTQVVLYGEIDGVSTSTWNFDFVVFIYKNNLQLS